MIFPLPVKGEPYGMQQPGGNIQEKKASNGEQGRATLII